MGAIENGDARVAAIYPIHMLGDPESPPDWLVAVAGDAFDETILKLFATFAEMDGLDLDAYHGLSDETLASEIATRFTHAGRKGFFIRTEVAIHEYVSEATSTWSWNYFQLGWLYLDDLAWLEKCLDDIAHASREASKAEWLLKTGRPVVEVDRPPIRLSEAQIAEAADEIVAGLKDVIPGLEGGA